MYICIYVCITCICAYVHVCVCEAAQRLAGLLPQVAIPQRGVQWKQGVVIYMMLYTSLLYNTTPIHCTPLRLHPPLQSIQQVAAALLASPGADAEELLLLMMMTTITTVTSCNLLLLMMILMIIVIIIVIIIIIILLIIITLITITIIIVITELCHLYPCPCPSQFAEQICVTK